MSAPAHTGMLEPRELKLDHLNDWFSLTAPHLTSDDIGPSDALAACRWMMGQPSFYGVAIGDPQRKAPVAFGAAVFVTEAFAEEELVAPRPGVNARILHSIHRGAPVVLSNNQLARSNRNGSLNVVILTSHWQGDAKNPNVGQLKLLLADEFGKRYEGYRMHRLIRETCDAYQLSYTRGVTVFREVAQTGPENCLFVVDKESVTAYPGTVVTGLFFHKTPILGLSASSQSLLLAALRDDRDEKIAEALNISVSAVRWRWAQVFAQASSVVEPTRGATRGAEKRSRILQYVRNHPHELRPYAKD